MFYKNKKQETTEIVWDSGGRYSSGFFWGNFYWLGSAALCRTLSSDSESKIEEKSSSGMDSAISRTDTAPFPTGFYVLKVQFNVSRQITPNVRSQLLGVCLPLSCGPREVEEVVGAGARLEDQGGPGYYERFNGSSVYPDWRGRMEVRLVKAPQTAYDMMRDPLFWTLVVVSCGVLLMVLAGTLFDFWSELCSNLGCGAKSRFHYINYAFNLGGHPPSLNQNGKRSARVTPAVTVTGPPDGTSPTADNHKMTIPRGNNNESERFTSDEEVKQAIADRTKKVAASFNEE
ncbi:hypothetical protein AAG570_011469 [Ranatra chinensis]|uniref:Nose resistant-to-fluoxetine protein N-terminal domain-containing protein n=1 Tax=Ranatra chinensis TaxID=642074 RepID=A0ABD0Z6Z2_9HEMI